MLLLLLTASVALAEPAQPFERFVVTPANSPPATIVGHFLPASPKAHGTIIFCHGYGNSQERFYGYDYLRSDMGWNVATFDFREHGESSRSMWSLTTLGYHEQWDLRAVIDWCEKRGAQKPYVLYGRSMGAATALLEASKDPRISGVIASSPFKNAWVATQQITEGRQKWRVASEVLYGLTYKNAMQSVDIPSAVALRKDLRVYIICGEWDCFPAADAQAILNASHAPASMKKLVVAPGKHHSNVWSWRGDNASLGHDQLIEQMLQDVTPATPSKVKSAGFGKLRWWIFSAAMAGIGLLAVRWMRTRPVAS